MVREISFAEVYHSTERKGTYLTTAHFENAFGLGCSL